MHISLPKTNNINDNINILREVDIVTIIHSKLSKLLVKKDIAKS